MSLYAVLLSASLASCIVPLCNTHIFCNTNMCWRSRLMRCATGLYKSSLTRTAAVIEASSLKYVNRDVAAAPQTPQLGGPRPTLGAQVSLKLIFGYVTIFSSADLFTTDLNCRKKLACDIISECNVILSRRI